MYNLAVLQNAPTMPVVSDRLAAGIKGYTDSWTPASRCDAVVIDEARALLPQLEAALAPASREQMEYWCRMLRKGIATLSDADFDARMSAVFVASGDLPARVWLQDTLEDALRDRECRFFSSSSIDALLRPRATALREQAWQISRVAKARPRLEPKAEKLNVEAIAQVHVNVQRSLVSYKGYIAQRHQGSDREKLPDDRPRTSYLSKAQLALSMPLERAMERPDLRTALEALSGAQARPSNSAF